MAKKQQQLYTGSVNEFVNWLTGVNSITKEEVTSGLPLSGSSIRELLMNKLKTPLYRHKDEANKLFRFFSSEDAYKLWLMREEITDEDLKKQYENLELFSIDVPSPYELSLKDVNNDLFQGGVTKYSRYGVNDDNSKVYYKWELSRDGALFADNLIVTYTIVDSDGKQSSFVRSYTQSLKEVEEDLSSYLTVGNNKVTMDFYGQVSLFTYSVAYFIEMIDLQITNKTAFQNGASDDDNGNVYSDYTISIDYTAPVGIQKNWVIRVYDTNTQKELTITDTNSIRPLNDRGNASYSIDPSTFNDGSPLSIGKHLIETYVYVVIDGNIFYSNVIYQNVYVLNNTGSKEVCISTSQPKEDSRNEIILYATQYEKFNLPYCYASTSASATVVQWKLYDALDDTYTIINEQNTSRHNIYTLEFIPDGYSTTTGQYQLKAYVKDSEVASYSIIITKSAYKVEEAPSYSLKLNTIGKANNDHTWTYGRYETTFTNLTWDSYSGWNDGALVLPAKTIASINYPLFNTNIPANGAAFEIDFKTSQVEDASLEIVTIGNPNGSHIGITPNSAYFAEGNSKIVTTNFKENERLKVCFIFNRAKTSQSDDDPEHGLVFIVTNGILERAATYSISTTNNTGITIGRADAKSAISIYSIRAYQRYITYEQAYNNFIFDSDNKAALIQKNDILSSSTNTIDIDSVADRIDVVILSGNVRTLIGSGIGKETLIGVTLLRICRRDPSKNMIIKNCRLRKHGQSTLNYPVPSFKIWSDSEFIDTLTLETLQGELYLTDSEDMMTSDNKAYKGRYVFKDGAIPAKKWVLQANYADSSGVHNGGIERLIQDTWYNANFGTDAKPEYKLRTPPQLFASNQKSLINDTTKEWNDGDMWLDYIQTAFPYTIRIAPDSFPCVVFYKDDLGMHFLGQYVFMDDKKSDYIYGERSIYNIPKDPFRFLESSKKQGERIWDNKDVIRLEVVTVNTPFADYRAESEPITISQTETRNVKYNETFQRDGETFRGWENDFELIYPDKEDLKDGEFDEIATKFESFYAWLLSTKKYFDDPANIADPYKKFRDEASSHLDLYKLAAYYIDVLRLGLADSLERNAQLKTYDGQHWHYEPWDIDIALGNRNTGGIAFNPPIDRNTRDGVGGDYALSGRSSTTSNWLFDALEAWTSTKEIQEVTKEITDPDTGEVTTMTYELEVITQKGWIDYIVPAVATALYKAGFTYANVLKYLDEEYQDKWCERLYNYSGHYKYIEASDVYAWLLGARTTHRHWWTSLSMDYWDAKWQIGDFMESYIYMAANYPSATIPNNHTIKIKTATDTYSGLYLTDFDAMIKFGEFKSGIEGSFDLEGLNLSQKSPVHIKGASAISDLDVSALAYSLLTFNLSGCYSAATGANLKTLNMGVPEELMAAGIMASNVNVTFSTNNKESVLQNLQTLNVRGHLGNDFNAMLDSMLQGMTSLSTLYAKGCNLTGFNGIPNGSAYNIIELPDTVTTLNLKSSSWTDLQFWHTNTGVNTYTFTRVNTLTHLNTIVFSGSTASNDCAKNLIFQWVSDIEAGDGNFADRTLKCYDINWSGVSYSDVLKLADFNNGQPSENLSGYILLSDAELTGDLIQELQTKFGNEVFQKSSTGLKIDYRRSTIIVTIGTNEYVTRVNNLVHFTEGYVNTPSDAIIFDVGTENDRIRKVPLFATQFMLSDNKPHVIWQIVDTYGSIRASYDTQPSEETAPYDPSTSNGNYNNAFFTETDEIVSLNIPYMRLDGGQPIEFFYVKCQVINPDGTLGLESRTPVYIDHAAYPTDLDIIPDSSLLVGVDGIIFSRSGTNYQFKVNYGDTYNNAERQVPVVNFEWSLIQDTHNAFAILNTSTGKNASKIQITRTSNEPNEGEEYTAQLLLTVTFKSGLILSTKKNLISVKDPIVLLPIGATSNPALVNAMTNYIKLNYDLRNHTVYTLSSILNFTISNNTSILDFTTDYLAADGVTTYKLPYFLTNVEEVNLSGLTSNDVLDFSNSDNLKKVIFSNSNLGIKVEENDSIWLANLGSPREIHFIDCSALLASNIVINRLSNLKSVDIVRLNENSTGAFAILEQIVTTPSIINFNLNTNILKAGEDNIIGITSDGSNIVDFTITGLLDNYNVPSTDSITINKTAADLATNINGDRIHIKAAVTNDPTIYCERDFFLMENQQATFLKNYNPNGTSFVNEYYFDSTKGLTLEATITISDNTTALLNILSIGLNIDTFTGKKLHLVYPSEAGGTTLLAYLGGNVMGNTSPTMIPNIQVGDTITLSWCLNIVTINGTEYTMATDNTMYGLSLIQVGSMLNNAYGVPSENQITSIKLKVLYTYIKENYSPNSAKWTDTISENLYTAEKSLEASIDLTNCTGEKENIFSYGLDISSGSAQTVHIYYTLSTRTLRFSSAGSYGIKELVISDSDVPNLIITANSTGLYINGSIVSELTTYNTNALNRSTLQVGSQEGSTRSHATYNYIRYEN